MRGISLGIAGTGDPNAPLPEGVLLGAGVPLGTADGFNVLRDVFHRREIDVTTVGFEAQFGYLAVCCVRAGPGRRHCP